MDTYNKFYKKLLKFWRKLGPGIITGAADDDPAGIATYAIAGAKTGNVSLWTMLYAIPFMVAIQEMSARIGITSACGLAGNIKRYYSKTLLFFMAAAILVTNIFNIGADVSAMTASIELLTPNLSSVVPIIIVVFIVIMVIVLPYQKIASIFKWVALSLLVYIIAGIFSIKNWSDVLLKTIIPTFSSAKDYLIVLVAVFGTTISPYLAFWQASEEAEEKRLETGDKIKVCKFRVVTRAELKHAMKDTYAGMTFSNIIGFFIIALTSSVLFSAGVKDIGTIKEAANALRPLAGQYSYLLFTLGVVSSGLLAIPVLAGSAAYVISEIFGWPASLERSFSKAHQFYLVIIGSTFLGLLISYFGFSPIKALFYTSILYGMIAPFIIAVIVHMANNSKIVGPHKSSRLINAFGWGTVTLMALGAITFILISIL